MRYLYVFTLSFILSGGTAQQLAESDAWMVQYDDGYCYHDTILYAVWIRIIPDMHAQYLGEDTSYLVVKAELVNKSPISLSFRGSGDKLAAYTYEETYVKDEEMFRSRAPIITKDSSRMQLDHGWGAMPMKRARKSAYLYFENNNFFRSIINADPDGLVTIEPHTRKVVYIPFPKHAAKYSVDIFTDVSRLNYMHNCNGRPVDWSEYRRITSNKVELANIHESD